MEDTEIDEDRFLTFFLNFKYLGSYFVPELNDTADITERISQARKLFGSMSKQLLGNKKIQVDIRRRLYQALVVNMYELQLVSNEWSTYVLVYSMNR
jgi:hypothetical protein